MLLGFTGGSMRVELFEDGIGAVEYVSHMGGDLSVVNAARVSFGSEKQEGSSLCKYSSRYRLEF